MKRQGQLSELARVLGITLVCFLACWTPPAAQDEPSVRPGVNDKYLDPELEVESWVRRFEGESREVFTARQEVLAATGVEPGHRVGDVGAGTGLFTELFARKTAPEGWVFAIDISAPFLQHIVDRAAKAELANVTAVLGRPDSIRLPPESIDVAFVCDTYHHFEFPTSMLASIKLALVDSGRLIVIDFERIPGESRPWIIDHVRSGKEVVRAEIEASGFELVREEQIEGLEENYFLVFREK
jgi:ubiquinone/menaquinone biosynthesis C-methylase UbiE